MMLWRVPVMMMVVAGVAATQYAWKRASRQQYASFFGASYGIPGRSLLWIVGAILPSLLILASPHFRSLVVNLAEWADSPAVIFPAAVLLAAFGLFPHGVLRSTARDTSGVVTNGTICSTVEVGQRFLDFADAASLAQYNGFSHDVTFRKKVACGQGYGNLTGFSWPVFVVGGRHG